MDGKQFLNRIKSGVGKAKNTIEGAKEAAGNYAYVAKSRIKTAGMQKKIDDKKFVEKVDAFFKKKK